MGDMTDVLFEDDPLGKAALHKMRPTPENFRLTEMEILDRSSGIMKVTGAEFRVAKSGKHKGRLSVMIPGTTKIAYVSSDEIREFESKAKAE